MILQYIKSTVVYPHAMTHHLIRNQSDNIHWIPETAKKMLTYVLDYLNQGTLRATTLLTTRLMIYVTQPLSV